MCSPKVSTTLIGRRDQQAIDYVDNSTVVDDTETRPLPAPIGTKPTNRDNPSASWFSRVLNSFRQCSEQTPSAKPQGRPFIVRTQLAHGGPMISITDVDTIGELYKAVAAAHGVRTDDILFCTRDTPHASMLALVGAELNDGDFVFAHIMGVQKEVTLLKTERLFGITLTDGCGKTLVKRLLPKSVCSAAQPAVTVGDAIVSINGVSMIGKQHFEVAKVFGAIPIGESVTLRLASPITSDDWNCSNPFMDSLLRFGSNGVQLRDPVEAPKLEEPKTASEMWDAVLDGYDDAEFPKYDDNADSANPAVNSNVLDRDTIEGELTEEPTVLKERPMVVVQPMECPSDETITALNQIFDEYLGMSDEDLSFCVWDIGVGCEFAEFAERLESELPMFAFPLMMIEKMAAVINADTQT